MDKFKDLCTPDFDFTAGPKSMTLEEYVALMHDVFASFPDIHFEASEVAEDGDTATVGKGRVREQSGVFFCLRCGMVHRCRLLRASDHMHPISLTPLLPFTHVHYQIP